jgi:trehalose-phosphatase
MRERLARSPLLVALDLDGTLAPIAPTPDTARVPDETRGLLSMLTTRPSVHVAFVTGRGAMDGRRLANVRNTWVIGNHGFELLDRNGELHVDPAAVRYGDRVVRAGATLSARLGDVAGVIVEDKQWSLSVHYRLALRDVVPAVETAVREAADATGLRLTRGKEILELRPPIEIDKGTAVMSLAARIGIGAGPPAEGAVFYAGDDHTDEDAFRQLRARLIEVVTVHVGKPVADGGMTTVAEFLVADTAEMKQLLDWLAGVR